MATPLQDYISAATSRLGSLDRRDQIALGALSAFVLGLVLVYGIWTPANDFYEARAAARERWFDTLQYMRSTEQEARLLGDRRAPAPTGQELLTQISRSAQQYEVSPNRLQPQGEGVSVWFDSVAFNDLIRWLEAQAEQGIAVQQVSIDRQETPGRVGARIVLSP